MKSSTVYAIAALVGGIIGAGVFGIPYTFAKAGVLLGLCNLVFVGAIVLLMNLMLGEITLRTKKSHMLPKLAEMFLNKKGKVLMFLGVSIGIWGAMVAYLIGVGESLAAIFGYETILGLNASLAFSLIFFITASALVYFGLHAVTRGELVLASSMIVILVGLCIWGAFRGNLANLSTIGWKYLFLPYGVVLFAILGTSMVPEMRRVLDDNKRNVKLALLIGTLIPMVLYALFAVVVVGVTGLATTEISTIGLGESLGVAAILFGNIFAVLAMASSYVILGLALRDSIADSITRLGHKLAFIITVSIPLVVFLLGVKSFINVIGITGALAGGLEGILIALMWRVAKRRGRRKPEFAIRFPGASYLLIIVFSLGIIYTVLNVVGVL